MGLYMLWENENVIVEVFKLIVYVESYVKWRKLVLHEIKILSWSWWIKRDFHGLKQILRGWDDSRGVDNDLGVLKEILINWNKFWENKNILRNQNDIEKASYYQMNNRIFDRLFWGVKESVEGLIRVSRDLNGWCYI